MTSAGTVAERERNEKQIQRVLADSEELEGPDEQPEEVDLHLDRMRTFQRESWSRMKLVFDPDELTVMQEIHAVADRVIQERFALAFHIQAQLYRHVRTPKINTDTGEVLYAGDEIIWELDEFGDPVEDWLSLLDRDRELLLHKITVHLFEWEQLQSRMWSDAMFAKGLWEEAFAGAYLNSSGRAIEDRTQSGRRSAARDRYFGLFQSYLSRRADAVVRSMTRLQWLLAKDYKK